MILACDVGGTKTNVALLEPAGSALAIVRFEAFRSRDHASLDDILIAFVGGRALPLDAAGFGVAGPVIAGRAVTTNLPWEIDARRLAERLGLPSVSLLNDVEAHAWSVDRLAPHASLTLQEGAPADGTVAVIAAGTGIGFSALIRSGTTRVSMASEGGHADFAARSPLEAGLLAFLRARHGQVSVERVLSGPGLVNVHEYVRESGGGEEPAWLSTALREGDPAAAISTAAMDGRSETCSRAVESLPRDVWRRGRELGAPHPRRRGAPRGRRDREEAARPRGRGLRGLACEGPGDLPAGLPRQGAHALAARVGSGAGDPRRARPPHRAARFAIESAITQAAR